MIYNELVVPSPYFQVAPWGIAIELGVGYRMKDKGPGCRRRGSPSMLVLAAESKDLRVSCSGLDGFGICLVLAWR